MDYLYSSQERLEKTPGLIDRFFCKLHMSNSREAYGVAKAIIDRFIPLISQDPAEAMRFCSIDCTMVWSSNEPATLYGKHSIYQFIKQLPLFKLEIETYDCHDVPTDNPIIVVVVTGKIVFYPAQAFKLHSSFHIELRDGNHSGLVRAFTMKLNEELETTTKG